MMVEFNCLSDEQEALRSFVRSKNNAFKFYCSSKLTICLINKTTKFHLLNTIRSYYFVDNLNLITTELFIYVRVFR